MNQQGQNQISASIQIVGIDQAGNKIIESGLLTDVTITADDNSNSLDCESPFAEHGTDRRPDQTTRQDPVCGVTDQGFPDQERRCHEPDPMLQTALWPAGDGRTVGVFSQTVGRTFGTQQQLQQSTAGESSLIPLNFGVDARTNSIIASGSGATWRWWRRSCCGWTKATCDSAS